ncbi:hypothetical protein WG66_008953 [Moniliophthora roreri]|nr:hypothetical protein WG66_008953 [Moniliophthora roreri]
MSSWIRNRVLSLSSDDSSDVDPNTISQRNSAGTSVHMGSASQVEVTHGTGRDEGLINIQVPKSFAENAAMKSLDALRKDLLDATEDLRRSQDKIQELHAELKIVKDSIAQNHKHEETMKEKLAEYETRISEAEKTIQELREGTTQNETSSGAPPQNGREKLKAKMIELPAFKGYRIQRGNLKAVSFIKMDSCFQMGWERDFEEKLNNAVSKYHYLDSGIAVESALSQVGLLCEWKFLYFPGLTFFVNEQHAITIAPKTQKNSKHNFSLLSSLDEMYGEERELFIDRDTAQSPSVNVFYAGRYRVVRLNDSHLKSVGYTNSFNREFGFQLHHIIPIVVGAQTQKPLLREDEIRKLVASGDIKLEFIGLQCVGFERELYHAVTTTTPITVPKAEPQSEAKRQREDDSISAKAAGGSSSSHGRPKKKKQKRV